MEMGRQVGDMEEEGVTSMEGTAPDLRKVGGLGERWRDHEWGGRGVFHSKQKKTIR